MNRLLALAMAVLLGLQGPTAFAAQEGVESNQESARTPIKHLVVIFDENISFDHYFGIYPYAVNAKANRSSSRRPIRPK